MEFKWNIIGHEEQKAALERDFINGNYAHAYLFVGENHVGKTTLARQLAENLQQGQGKLDTVELLGRQEKLKVAEVRALIEKANLSAQAAFKIFIVQNVERMTREAANAFLKTLEEPPERTLFFLTTQSAAALLPTVVSRTRIVKFSPVWEYGAEELGDLAFLAAGKPGKARLIEENEMYGELYAELRAMLGGELVDNFALAEKLAEDKERLTVFMELLEALLRQRLLEGKIELKKLCKIQELGMLLGKNVNARLVLENLMLEL